METAEQILSSRHLLSRQVMRIALCNLYTTRNNTNELGSIGNVKFEDHFEFANKFVGPNGEYFIKGQEDLFNEETGGEYWSRGATEQNFAHIVALGDVHSDFLSLLSALFLAKVIDVYGRWIASNTIVIQLGDILDRNRPGMDGAKHTSYNNREEVDIIQYLYHLDMEARVKGSRIISITGNHDIWPYEGPSSRSRKGYVGQLQLDMYGSMKKRDQYFKSKGMRNYMAWYRPPIMKVNNWLAMHGGIHPDNLHRRMLELEKSGDNSDPIAWMSDKWMEGILNPRKNFPAFIMDAMYNRYWATNPHDQNVDECSDHMMTMLRHFNIDSDGGVFLGHTPMWISKCGNRDGITFNNIEVVCNARCTTAACGVVLADVAASEGFHELYTGNDPTEIKEYKDEDVQSTSVVHVNVRKNTLDRIRTDYKYIRIIERFNGKKWNVVKKEKLSRNLKTFIESVNSVCE